MKRSSFMPNVALAVAEPAAGGNLLLSEKLHAFSALHVQVAKKGIVPAVEGKPRHRCRHTDIDANHTAVDSMLELAGSFAVTRKNGRAVAEGRFIGQCNGGIEVFHVHDVEHGAENFFLRDSHAGLNLVEDGCADEEAVGRFANFYAATVGGDFGTLLHAGFDEFQNAVAMLGGNDGAHVRLRVTVGGADFDSARSFDERGQNGFFRHTDYHRG